MGWLSGVGFLLTGEFGYAGMDDSFLSVHCIFVWVGISFWALAHGDAFHLSDCKASVINYVATSASSVALQVEARMRILFVTLRRVQHRDVPLSW